MTYIYNPIKYVGLENKRWTYQDFSAGSITGTSVTLTANERGVNEDGSPLSFDSSKIISSTALILRSDNDKAVQRSGVTGFLGKVKVSAHSGASVTLSHIPNSSAPIRIWYHYSELSANIKNQTAVPPMFTGKQIEDMEAIFNSKADTSLASVSEASSPTQITTSDTVLTAFGKIMKYITDFLTTFNAANKLVKMTSDNKLPALDGSLLTNISVSGSFSHNSSGQTFDFNSKKTTGGYAATLASGNKPSGMTSEVDYIILLVYEHGSNNGIQKCFSADRDSSSQYNLAYYRCWEGSQFTNWVSLV